MDFGGKVAIVTGGSNGIGKESAVLFAKRGARVVVSDIADEAGEAVAAEIRQAGGQAEYIRCDVSKSAQWQAMVKQVIERWGRIDMLVNNAGVLLGKKVVDQTEEELDLLYNVDVKGVFLGCKYTIPEMLKVGGGSIVNLGSISGLVGLTEQAGYCMAKGAVVNLTKQIAVDYSREGIRCNVVCPGSIMTDVLRKYFTYLTPEGIEALKATHPINRFGEPIEVANTIVWLCSDEASFITGAPISVDGGYVAG